jgi:hypothetical protein
MPFPMIAALGGLGSLLGLLGSHIGKKPGGMFGQPFGGKTSFLNNLVGPALGGLGGAGLGSLLSGGMGGTPGHTEQFQRFSPQQQGWMNQLGQQGMQNMDTTGMENRAMKTFNERIVPSLAERFTAMGSGSQGSSAFTGQLGQAGADISSQMAAMRPAMGMQQLGMGLQPQFESAYFPRQAGFAETAGTSGLQGLMSILPMLLAGR